MEGKILEKNKLLKEKGTKTMSLSPTLKDASSPQKDFIHTLHITFSPSFYKTTICLPLHDKNVEISY